MKYKILFDYGSDGYKFQDEEYNSVSEAVKQAIKLNYCSPFLIVQIIDWEARNSPDSQPSALHPLIEELPEKTYPGGSWYQKKMWEKINEVIKELNKR